MRRRKILLVGTCLTLVLLLLFFGYLLLVPRGPSTHITRTAYERIRLGMTVEEAQAVIGLPLGDYRTEASSQEHAPADENEAVPGLTYAPGDSGPDPADWMSDKGCIWLEVDPERGVVAKHYGTMRDAKPTLLERVRGWLGL
jgi:hypothetical protein